MPFLGYRSKSTVTRVVCLVVLLVICGTVLTRGITSQIPTGTWAPAGNGTHLSAPRAGAAAVQLQDGRLLITGGDDGSGAVANADIYDTSGNFLAAAPMNAARSQHTATVLPDGTVLVAGGVGSRGASISSAEVYNPATNKWSTTANLLLAPRSGHTATALPDGTVLLAGGDSSGTPLSSLEIYNPADGTSAAVQGSLSSPRELHAAAALQNGDVIFVGGSNGTVALATSDIYSFASGTVSAGQVMSTPRIGLSATTQLDGKVLVAGGNSGSANGNQDIASAEVYDPGVGAFTPTGSLGTARQRHQAFLLPHNGSILIVGGTSPVSGVETPVASVEMYYPQSAGQDAAANWNGTFHTTSSMASARVSATGTSPSDGTPQSQNDGLLLIAGGKDASGAALASGELYGFAWVKTDAVDYAPGTPVTITGGGWQPGETVTLHLQEVPYYDTHADLTATVQSDGTFSNSQFAPDSHDVGIRFYLSVVGSVSGSQAQSTFTDNNVTVASAPSGVTFTFPWTSFKGLNCGGGTNTSGSNAINSSGVNIGIGNPASIQFEAPGLSDQGGSFTNWKQGSTILGSSSTICINNPSGTYTATYSTTAVAPTVTSVSPNTGDLGQAMNGITLTGTGLTASTQVNFGPGITVGATTVNSTNTQLTFNATIAMNATLGAHSVSVTNAAGSGGGGGTATLTNGFLVNSRTTSITDTL